MNSAKQLKLADRLLSLIDNNETELAPKKFNKYVSGYIDKEIYQIEIEKLFKTFPLCIGLSCRIRDKGSWFTEDVAGTSILVVRDKKGAARAYLNMCMHRGSRIVEGFGLRAKSFKCPYHAWVYSTEGILIGRPRDLAFTDSNEEKCFLKEFKIEEHEGLLWLSLNDGKEHQIADSIKYLGNEISGWNLQDYHHYKTARLNPKINWKMAVDTFLEIYHISSLHGNSLSSIIVSDTATFEQLGNHARIVGARHSIKEMRNLPRNKWDFKKHTIILTLLFPNCIFIMQGDHVEVWHIYPGDNEVDESNVIVSLYTPEKAETEKEKLHWENNFDLLMKVVYEEDFPLSEKMYKNFKSNPNSSIVFGRNEPGLQHFHNKLEKELF